MPTSTKFKILSYLLLVTFFACKQGDHSEQSNTQRNFNVETISSEGENILIGPVTRQGIQSNPYNLWFEETYRDYQVDSMVLDTVVSLLDGITVKLFLATWCEDSQREVPSFFKIMDYLGFNYNKLDMICVDREKKSNGGETENMNIEFVPTFIFYRQQKEIGRIVEMPSKSLELDLLAIIK